MDPATHLLTTALLFGRQSRTLWSGLAPDLAFYVTYPCWWLWRQRRPAKADSGDPTALPMPPRWIQQLHYATHSLMVVALIACLLRSRPEQRKQMLGPWLLHLALDIPSHARARMAPRLLWPLSDWAFDGLSWSDALYGLAGKGKR